MCDCFNSSYNVIQSSFFERQGLSGASHQLVVYSTSLRDGEYPGSCQIGQPLVDLS